MSASSAAAARTRVKSAQAMSSTGGESVSAPLPAVPSSGTFTPKTDAGLARPAVDRRSRSPASRSPRALFCAARLPDVRPRRWPARGAGWDAAEAGTPALGAGALDVSGGLAGAGAVGGEGAASAPSDPAPGAASGSGGATVGAGSGAGAPPEPGADVPPDWASAGGAAKAVMSRAKMACRAHFEHPALTGLPGSNSCRVASRSDAASAFRTPAIRASSTAPP